MKDINHYIRAIFSKVRIKYVDFSLTNSAESITSISFDIIFNSNK